MFRMMVLLCALLIGASVKAYDPCDRPEANNAQNMFYCAGKKAREQAEERQRRERELQRERSAPGVLQGSKPAPALVPLYERDGQIDALRRALAFKNERDALAAVGRLGRGPLPAFDGGVMPLMVAAWQDHGQLAQSLAALGPVSAKDMHGNDALLYAAAGGGLGAIQMVLSKGAECNADGWSPLALAAARRDSKMVAVLLVLRYEPDGCRHAGVPPLVVATAAGDSESVRLLLERGASPDLNGRFGKTAPQLLDNPAAVEQVAQAAAAATDRMRAEIDRVLARHLGKAAPAGARPAASFPVPALGAADRELVVKVFAKSLSSKSLIEAARAGDVAAAQAGLALGADPYLEGKGGESPLLMAARHGRAKVLEVLLQRQGYFNVIAAMVEAGRGGHADTLRVLLTRRPTFVVQQHELQTVLSTLATQGPLHANVARLLLEAGAKGGGLLPAVLASADAPDLLQVLIDSGVDVKARMPGFAKPFAGARDSMESDQTSLMYVSQAGGRPRMARVLAPV